MGADEAIGKSRLVDNAGQQASALRPLRCRHDEDRSVAGRAQPPRGLAPVHPDEAPRRRAVARHRARRRRLADRYRRPALSRRRVVVVGQPVRSQPAAHQGGDRRPARAHRARDAGGPDARARRAAVGAAGRADGPRPCLLRQRRRQRDGDRAEDERALLAQPRAGCQDALRRPRRRLPRRDGGRAVGHRHRAVPRGLRPARAPVGHRAEPRCAARPRRPQRRRTRRGLHRRARSLARRTSCDDGGADRRAAGAVRRRHGDARRALPAARARTLPPLGRAPDRRRDRGRLRSHRHALRVRAGRHSARLHLPVQRADRRLPAALGGADGGRGLCRVLRR